ncbi:flagellar hook-associated protein FlgK [Inediibacterium massiliense]|uniref:flagellar hook-associated protein FlgK n=1 Tax=Inediibacterium massiliense TaxID=1658111 RepID=UPI0006B539A4|nr:flagellar hook-associated protein FlgK [Inediibacterium massiliense]
MGFFGLNIARSGLFASQRALEITGHNISNVNTPGYSRQRLEMNESFPMPLPGGQGMQGTGVDTAHIQQIRDEFLDFKIRQEFMTAGEWDARYESLTQIEAIFNEPSEDGIRKSMDEFFNSIQQLSQGEKADNLTVRALVRERGIHLTKTLNHMYTQLENMQKNIDFAVQTTVDQVNGYAEQIAKLNEQIFGYELDGSNANDLRDQRNLLIDELSQLVDIQIDEMPIQNAGTNAKKMRILVGGNMLVSHETANKLITVPREPGMEKNKGIDQPKLLDVTWENGGSFKCREGKLKGLIDMRDNIDGSEKGIPYYMDQLNQFSTTFAARFNMQHGQGYGLAGAGNEHAFFNVPPLDYTSGTMGYKEITVDTTKTDADIKADYKKDPANEGKIIFKANGKWYETEIIRAKDLSISADIAKDPNNIAAAKIDNAVGDGSNALELLNLRQDGNMFAWGKPDDFFKSLISNLGVDGQAAKTIVKSKDVLIKQLDNKRQSISGVSLDEEMGNMIKYQHAYNASARMITTIDEMLDKIINGMGVVGR